MSAVVVEVVLREVGEQRHLDVRAGQAALLRGRSTRPRSRRPRSPASTKSRSACCSVTGSGVVRPVASCAVRAGTRRLADAQRADHAAAPAQAGQRLRRPPGGGGLAVGAGGGDDLQRARSAGPGTGAAIGPTSVLQVRRRRRCARRRSRSWPGGRSSTRQAAAPRPQRRADEAARRRAHSRARRGRHRPAAPGGCRCAGGRATRARQPLRGGGGMGQVRERGHGHGAQKLSRSAGTVLLAMICGVTSMSGGTLIRRSVCCTTWLNTGAATAPP